MPYREEVNYIAIHDEMPEHPKVEPLGDASFRLWVETLCYCSRRENDGYMDAAVWVKRGKASTRKELEDAGLVELHDDGRYEVHDYLDMQRSRAEIVALKAKRSEAGRIGNHRKHHVARGIVAKDCNYCLKGVAS
jgi:hypothetical protein